LGIFLALVATICAWRMARELNQEQGAPRLAATTITQG
jgi:hypothetical protein